MPQKGAEKNGGRKREKKKQFKTIKSSFPGVVLVSYSNN